MRVILVAFKSRLPGVIIFEFIEFTGTFLPFFGGHSITHAQVQYLLATLCLRVEFLLKPSLLPGYDIFGVANAAGPREGTSHNRS
jgi:hypothetical protein